MNDVNETVSAIAMFLIDDTDSDLETPFKNYLDIKSLDYSLKSLKVVDNYLEKIRKKIKSLSDKAYAKIILRCGAYCGEVIRRNSKLKFKWTTYDDAIKINKSIKDFGKSPMTFYILYQPKEKGFSFPMAKVKKFIEEGKGDDLYSFAIVIGHF